MAPRRSFQPIVLLFSLAACAAPAKAPEATVDPAAVKSAIQAREKEWSAAFLARNAAGVATLYTEDGAQVQPASDAYTGRDGITKAMQAQFDTIATVTAREDITEEVFPAGNYVTEVGHYSFAGTSTKTKKAIGSAGRYMVLWRKDADGVWRLLRDIGSEAPAKKP